MTNYEELRRGAESYYALCDRARAVGVPTSVDDPESPPTVEELRVAVEQAEAKR